MVRKDISAVLQQAKAGIRMEQFDAQNQEHLRAFRLLLDGRQHPTIRFKLELPYDNVRQMMLHKVSYAYLATNHVS